MRGYTIKEKLKREGYSLTDIAIKHEVGVPMISKVVHNETTSRRIADYIAGILDKPAHKIWPRRYKKDERRAE
jgi:lambda repressor-like predicted transcriptional regulator